MIKSKIKILLISPLPPPVGGIATWTRIILDYFNNKSTVNIIHYNNNINQFLVINKNLIFRILYGIKNSIFQLYQIFNLIKKENPNLIHLNTSASFSLLKDYLVIKISKYFNIDVIIHLHFGRVAKLKSLNNLEWRLLLNIINNSKKCIVLDNLSKTILNSEGFSNIIVIANPIKFDYNKAININKKIDTRNVLFVGHITKEKGIFELIEATKNIKSIDNLILVGPYNIDMKNLLLNIAGPFKNKVIFTGVLNKEEVLIRMKSCTIFVLPSYSEGFPNVILEAMTCACAIISTNVGAISDILEDNCGICIQPKNIYQLNSSITNLLSNDGLRFKLGENAYNKVNNKYIIEKVGLEIENIWSE